MLARYKRTALSLACLIGPCFALEWLLPKHLLESPLKQLLPSSLSRPQNSTASLLESPHPFTAGDTLPCSLSQIAGCLTVLLRRLLWASLNVTRESYPLSPTTQKTTRATPTYTGLCNKPPCLAPGTSTSVQNSLENSVVSPLARTQNRLNSNSIE
jgi:hypothetical protein